MSQLGGTGGATRIKWVENRDAAKQPTKHRRPLTVKNYLIQNVNKAEAEKACTRGNMIEKSLCSCMYERSTETLFLPHEKRSPELDGLLLWGFAHSSLQETFKKGNAHMGPGFKRKTYNGHASLGHIREMMTEVLGVNEILQETCMRY